MKNKGLFILYSEAGPDFLAYRLASIFTELKTPEEVTMHNAVMAEVLQMINSGYAGEGQITKGENELCDI